MSQLVPNHHRLRVIFHYMLVYCEELLVYSPKHPRWRKTPCLLSETPFAVHSQIPSTLEEFCCKRNFRMRHAVVTGTHLAWQTQISYYSNMSGGPRWRNWLRHCATSRKVAGSIPDGVTGTFHWHNPSGRTMALGSTLPLTEMSNRNISWGVKAAGV